MRYQGIAPEEKLKSLASRYIRIDGHTPQHNRPALVEEFQSNPEVQVALLSITACGQGPADSGMSICLTLASFGKIGNEGQADFLAQCAGLFQGSCLDHVMLLYVVHGP